MRDGRRSRRGWLALAVGVLALLLGASSGWAWAPTCGEIPTLACLLGRSGGQTLIGGTGSGESLTLQSTSHATRGGIIVSDQLRLAGSITGETPWLDAQPSVTLSTPTTSLRSLYLHPTVDHSASGTTLAFGEVSPVVTLNTTGAGASIIGFLLGGSMTSAVAPGLGAAFRGLRGATALVGVSGKPPVVKRFVSDATAISVSGGAAVGTTPNAIAYEDFSSVALIDSGTTFTLTNHETLHSEPSYSVATGATLTAARRVVKVAQPNTSDVSGTANIENGGVDIDQLAAIGTGIVYGIRNASTSVYTTSPAQTLTASTATLADATEVQINSSGNVTITAAPSIANGQDGQRLCITNTDTQGDVITYQDQDTLASTNLQLGAPTRALRKGDRLCLKYDSTLGDWFETSFTGTRVAHAASWYFPGLPTAGVQAPVVVIPPGLTNCAVTGASIAIGTVAANNSVWNIQRCTANCDGSSAATFSDIWSADDTINNDKFNNKTSGTLTTTIASGDLFKVDLSTVGASTADYTVTMNYACDA